MSDSGQGSGKKRGAGSGPAGTVLRASGKDGPQRIRLSGSHWTDEAEHIFLDCLAASCNVRHAARACGFTPEALYKRRRRDPGFAERWQAALDQGYVRIEMALVEAAENALAGRAPDPDHPILPMTAADALNVLKLHRASVRGGGAPRPGWPARPRSLEEVRSSILAKLAAFDRARKNRGKA